MSIHTDAAVKELNKEISRLIGIRDSLLSSKNERSLMAVPSHDGLNGKSKPAKKGRTISLEARKRMAEGQRKRWAALKKSAK